MCGIVGYVSSTQYRLDKHLLALKHRGPDASGAHYNTGLGLGHTRLSIVDAHTEANQPFILEDGQFILVFNGEIYNFKELRDILKNKGHIFSTASDTEVLLNSYQEYGTDMFTHLDGMFAFALFDKKRNTLLCARDHLGIKPFYYYLNNDTKEFFFASELSALFEFPLKKSVNENSIAEFLYNCWIYEPDTGYKDIYKLKPGEYIEIELDSFETTKKIYFTVTNTEVSYQSKNIDTLIKRSVFLQSYNEVKMGNFFSGGIDSTVIASLIDSEAKNLTVDFDKNHKDYLHDDTYFAKKIASVLKLDVDYIAIPDTLSPLEKIQYVAKNTEDLVADFTFLATEEISKESNRRGYKIMLSGMGADELFCGYPRYKIVHYDKLFRFLSKLIKPFYPLLRHNKQLAKKIDRYFSYFSASSFGIAYSQLLGYFSHDEVNALLKNKKCARQYEEKVAQMLENVKGIPRLKQAMYLDIYGFLSHNFMIADKASMRHSLELRVPLATKDILQKNFHLSSSRLLSFNKTKIQLRNLLYGSIPKQYVDRKKIGFNPPLDHIIHAIGEKKILEILKHSEINSHLNISLVNTIVKKHFQNKENNTYKIWQILYLHYWMEHNFTTAYT